VEAGRDFGLEYQTVECIIRSKNFPEERIERESPWAVYDSGIREKGSRVAKPNVVTDMKELIEYLPAQLEIGGGASLELGIPPLNYFHTVYDLYREGFERFAYGDYDKLLDTVLPDPDAFYSKLASLPYLRALLAEPNNFYKTITDLHRKNLLLGPIITNNFDGMCSLMGLEELYVRKYDDVHIIPSVSFPEGVKSLLVVGSHADRRRIQQAAKQEGLKIIYVDPEKYVDHEGRQIDYPLEKIESDDILVPLKASEFAEELSNALSGPSKIV